MGNIAHLQVAAGMLLFAVQWHCFLSRSDAAGCHEICQALRYTGTGKVLIVQQGNKGVDIGLVAGTSCIHNVFVTGPQAF